MRGNRHHKKPPECEGDSILSPYPCSPGLDDKKPLGSPGSSSEHQIVGVAHVCALADTSAETTVGTFSCEKGYKSQGWCRSLIIPAPGRWRQGDQKLKVLLTLLVNLMTAWAQKRKNKAKTQHRETRGGPQGVGMDGPLTGLRSPVLLTFISV